MQIKHSTWTFEYVPNKCSYQTINTNQDILLTQNFIPTTFSNKEIIDAILSDYKKASVIHKLVRKRLNEKIATGTKYLDLANYADEIITSFNGNMAFPLGISANNIAAHDTAMAIDDRCLKQNDIVKIDLGIHVNGCIIDSAYTKIVDASQETYNFYEPLLLASQDSLYTGLALSGPDAILYEISEAIQEVIESYELEDGTPIKPVIGLGGHDVLPYKVHGKKLILSVPNKEYQKDTRMEQGEFFALETFATTGTGKVHIGDLLSCNHFMLSDNKLKKPNDLTHWIENKNNNLPFTQRQLKSQKNCEKDIKNSLKLKDVIAYPPLLEKVGKAVAQFEHTFYVGDCGIDILSLGEDY